MQIVMRFEVAGRSVTFDRRFWLAAFAAISGWLGRNCDSTS